MFRRGMMGNVLDEAATRESQPKSFMTSFQRRWEARSSIRSRPEKYIDMEQSGYFFPVDKQPVLLDSQVSNLGEPVKQEILLQSFYKYLNDIVTLEIKHINAACHNIIEGDLPITYPKQAKLNAYTILIDEYYHVYIAENMMMELDYHFPNRKQLDYPVSDSYYAVEQTKQKLDDKYHIIFEIIAVCIFETTLIRELVTFFNSPEVHPSIKYYVNDHMNDEGRHYGYFYELLEWTWSGLPEDYKQAIGSVLPYFIKLYLNVSSEKQFNINLLRSILPEQSNPESIVDNIYHGFDITPDVPIVKNVLQVLQKTGVKDYSSVTNAFKQIGWDI